MVKTIVILMLVVAAAIFVAMRFTDMKDFDPTEQGKQARAAIQPGMTLRQVIDATRAPNRYRNIRVQEVTDSFGNKTEIRKEGAVAKFDLAMIENTLKNNGFKHGFILPYSYSEEVAFDVWFDGTGTVESVQDAVTMSDLLDMP